MSDHTPGYWEAEEGLPYNRHPRVYAADGRLVCEVGNAEEFQETRWEADARLIAAAPDMLAALQAILAPYKGLFSIDGHLGGCDLQTIEAAFDAVAKASGKPERPA